jgi:hypothetical protein
MSEREDRRTPSACPAIATAENGVVLLDGPQGAVAALTPEAAEATSENLRRAASQAARQRRTASYPVPLRPKV